MYVCCDHLELFISERREVGSVSETDGWVTVIDILDPSIDAIHIAIYMRTVNRHISIIEMKGNRAGKSAKTSATRNSL